MIVCNFESIALGHPGKVKIKVHIYETNIFKIIIQLTLSAETSSGVFCFSQHEYPAEHAQPGGRPLQQAGDHQELDHLHLQVLQAVPLREVG